MADIFISYKREDRRVAERLSIALEQLGFDVWWDFEILSGDRFRRVVEKVIDECKVAIVLFNFPPNSGAVGSAAYLTVDHARSVG